MAIISAGYDGTVDEVQFADLLHRYSVLGPDDFSATTQAGDRIVAIGDGTAFGPGTVDVATGIPAIQFAVASGTRWDLVVLRRNWQPPGGSTEVVIVQGTSTKGYPAVGTATTDWNRRPGIMDDQPLYLQEVNGTLLGQRIDLRCWAGHNGLVAVSEDVKTYLSRVGAEFYVAGVLWRYILGANNVPTWDSTLVSQWSSGVTTYGPGWSPTANHTPRLYKQDGMVFLTGALTIANGASFDNMLTIPTAFRPASSGTRFVGSGVSSNGVAYELAVANGKLLVPDAYRSGGLNAGHVAPIAASWPIT